jgi:hypothetical protein
MIHRAAPGSTHHRSTGRALVLLVTLLAVTLGLSWPAHAAAARGPLRTVAFHAHEDDIGGTIVPQACSLNYTGVCEFTYTGHTQWTGDIEGWETYRGFAHFNPATQHFDFEVWEDFVAVTVKGCGTGRMEWHGTGEVRAEDQRPTTGYVLTNGAWRFVQGSGTGGLAGVTDGAFEIHDIKFTMPFLENHEDVDGTITCRMLG